MSAPLLETKLFVPRVRPGLVSRPRLAERLHRGAASTLTLVSAPAGFGKSTLLTEWLALWLAHEPGAARAQRRAAWLSLDPSDNEPASFWSYVVAAARTAAPDVGGIALALLQEPQPPPIQRVLTTFLNDLGAVPGELVLVLDDYHVIDSLEVQDAMAFLLDHLPPRLHLVIASRADPALPLARLRARAELVEVRAADLRFTRDEAGAYLNETMGLRLTAADVAALEGRTEGWVAALQLAALSLQGRGDMSGFIAGFAGDDRYVVDYLVEEVVQRQPDPVQAFLLRTSVLGRLSGSLCDAVTGQSDGRSMLQSLDRANLFLVPLDDRRHWYRYHHLFADVLQARLLDERPDLVPELHQRASAWWERNGEQSEAVRHALAGNDFERAAGLVEATMPDLRRDRRDATLLSWLEMLPDEAVLARPWLCIAHVGALLSTGEVLGVESRLQDVERWVTASASRDGPPVSTETAETADTAGTDASERRRLLGWVAVYRAGLALALGDAATTVTRARSAVALLDGDDHVGHGAAEALVGLASWGAGDLEAAHDGYAGCLARMRQAGHLPDVLGCTVVLADILTVQGRLREAITSCEQALGLAGTVDGPALRGTPDVHVASAMLDHELGDRAAAAEQLTLGQEAGEHTGLPRYPFRWRVALSRVREAEGDLPGAVELLDEAISLYVGDFSPDVQPVAAMRARMWVRQGRLTDALGWVRERGLSTQDELSYVREFEHVTLARVLLAEHRSQHPPHRLEDVTSLLERLLRAAEAGGRTGSLIEILVLQALTHQLRGDTPAALAALRRGLELAEPQGYVRVFVDEGAPMATLLRAGAHGRPRGYLRRLLDAFVETADASAEPTESTALRGPVDPLSGRELEVLRLLASDLSGPDIARELVVSLNTVRTHTKSIYAKLGANSRRAAVRRAAELDLLSRTGARRGSTSPSS